MSTGIDTWRKEGEGDQARCCEAEKILVFYGVDENSRILSCLSIIGVKNILICFFLIKKWYYFPALNVVVLELASSWESGRSHFWHVWFVMNHEVLAFPQRTHTLHFTSPSLQGLVLLGQALLCWARPSKQTWMGYQTIGASPKHHPLWKAPHFSYVTAPWCNNKEMPEEGCPVLYTWSPHKAS